jgi:threonine aldolase
VPTTPIDYRSDFLAPPTEAMIAAMTAAAHERPGFGLTGDPTVSALEAKAAALLGKEAALFCPTCTMCNQIAIWLHCGPGESVLAHEKAHIFLGESGSLAALARAMAVPIPGRRGAMDLKALEARLHRREIQRSRAALVVLENTHANLGGVVVPADYGTAVRALADAWGFAIHLDGARLPNAAAYLGLSMAELAAPADSLSLSLNKGLAAPVGAVLAGRAEFIAEANHVRQLLGGGWRPANIPAAAAIVALDTMLDRIGEDHATARRLGEGLAACPGIAVDPDRLDTNIVFADMSAGPLSADDLIAALDAEAILALPASGARETVRFVTHHGVTRDDVERTLEACRGICG